MGGYADIDDDRLLALTQSDPDAFGEFYDRHVGSVLRYLLRRQLAREDAVDLTAEVFAAALVASRRYKPGNAPASAWLFGIARHKLAKTLRRGAVERAARRKLGLASISFSEEALDRVEDRLDAAQRIDVRDLDGLSQAVRGAVQARVIDERSYDAIAAEEGTSSAAIRQRVRRGLAQLNRKELTDDNG